MSFLRYGEYKDSGARWLGRVPTSWTVKALKHVFTVVGGSTPKSEVADYWDGEHVWVTPADLSGLRGFEIIESSRRITTAGLASCGTNLVPAESIVLSTRAPIGSLAIAGTSLCTNQGCKSLVRKGNGNSRFYAYLLSVAGDELNLRGRGTTFLELSADALGAFEVVEPKPEEQDAIATFLDCETAKIDALVEEQRRLIELLKEKRQAVISRAVTKGLNPNVPMKDSGVEWLGEVPAHWQTSRLANLYSDTDERGNADLPVLTVSIHDGVSDDELDEADMDRKVTRSDDKTKYKRVAPGDLVYNMMRAWQGGFGSVTVDGMVSPAYVVARPRTEFPTSFVERVLRTPNAIEEMRGRSRGVTDFRLRLYWEEFKNIVVPLPPKEEVESIVKHLEASERSVANTISAAEDCIAILQERRSALISAAVTGKIDVRRLARQPEGAAA